MARFSYRALNAEGATLDGEVAAASEREAIRVLEQRGLSVFSIGVAGEAAQGRGFLQRQARLKAQDVILSFQELATLLRAGVGLAQAVDAQTTVGHHPKIRDAFSGMSAALRQGQPFSQALAQAGLPLPRYVDTLVRSGEKAGLLARAVHDSAEQMEYERKVRAEVRQALTYPVILVLAGLGAVVMMFTFVVPKFAVLMKRAKDLPWLASAVLNSGMFVREHIFWFIGGLVALAVTGAILFSRAAFRARAWEALERVPVLGTWRVESEVASWARVLSTLLGNRVPLLDALRLGLDTVASPRRRARLEEATRAVRAGTTLADALEEQNTLSVTGYNLVRVGQQSGELPAMLDSLARLYEESGRARIKQFLALLEPIAILLIGGAVGLIMTGIILAITSANDLAR